jgi:hypothetical protein
MRPADRLVFLRLLRNSGNDSGAVPAPYAPSLAKLARETGLDPRTVTRSLAHLERHGWIGRDRTAGGRGNRSGYMILPAGGVVACDCPGRAARSGRAQTGAQRTAAWRAGKRAETGAAPASQQGPQRVTCDDKTSVTTGVCDVTDSQVRAGFVKEAVKRQWGNGNHALRDGMPGPAVPGAERARDGGFRCPLCSGDHPACRFAGGSLYCVADGCANPHHRAAPAVRLAEVPADAGDGPAVTVADMAGACGACAGPIRPGQRVIGDLHLWCWVRPAAASGAA